MTSDFTPFGYLRNPGHVATSWRDSEGGNLRTASDRVAVEWAYPTARSPLTRVGLGVETTLNGRPYRTRSDFDALGLTSRYHSCLIFGFDWQLDDVAVEVRFFLANDDALCLRLSVANHATSSKHTEIGLCPLLNGEPVAPAGPDELRLVTATPLAHVTLPARGTAINADIAPGSSRRVYAVLARGATAVTAQGSGEAALDQAETRYERLLAEDAEFSAGCPTLSGDWPAHWHEGLFHDFQTTRMLVQPAGGIFADVWPSWMVAWPRVVFAEGTLDMLRLAYADPALAKRAVLSLFRDAPLPNVPCVFRGGQCNMVAADGSLCGTSPAWCLPFLNLELLYLRTLDRDWLTALYPYAAAFVDWWLEHRVDADGWVVYKCTWESGEDGNPRLDPSGSGDADISGRVRPVELQATLTHAAGVLAFFASELHLNGDLPRWRAIESAYRERTRRLFDRTSGRYRDQVVSGDAPKVELYWGIDPHRYSVQSLTPLLIGEPLDAAEVRRHACPPWTLWPSWTTTLVESAAAAGLCLEMGVLAFETIDRVYRVTTRHELGALSRPLPGAAPEFWPADWQTYDGSEAYGWGAATATLLIRHLFGFRESRQTDGWTVDLVPALPRVLLETGRRYGIRRLNYRGLIFDLHYAIMPDSGLLTELDLGNQARECSVEAAMDPPGRVYSSTAASSRHRFVLLNGRSYSLRLR